MKYHTVENTDVKITKLVPGGQALATLPDGKKAFFWNALPGETITSYQVTKSKSSYLEAIALTIANPSTHRITPQDPCYLSTSPWQIMDYDYELQQKVALVKECFRQAGIEGGWRDVSSQGQSRFVSSETYIPDGAVKDPKGLSGTPSGMMSKANKSSGEEISRQAPPMTITDDRKFHYRNKMEYSLYWDNSTEKISLAFHQRGSHRKIPITQSSLEHPEIFQKAQEIVADLNAHHEEARKYQSLMLRCDQQGNVSGGLFINGQPHPDFPPLTDTILGHKYTYSPNGFFQINLPVYELALQEIAKYITTEKVLDLYAGVGTIGLSVARDRELTLVEVNKAAYAELVENCKRAGGCFPKNIPQSPSQNDNILGRGAQSLSSRDESARKCCNSGKADEDRSEGNSSRLARAILTNAEDALDFITGAETVILDPPRAGCHPQLLAKLTEQTPPTIIYLSCNPITQARDVAILNTKYKIVKTQVFNFFPRTPHIESLVILKQK